MQGKAYQLPEHPKLAILARLAISPRLFGKPLTRTYAQNMPQINFWRGGASPASLMRFSCLLGAPARA